MVLVNLPYSPGEEKCGINEKVCNFINSFTKETRQNTFDHQLNCRPQVRFVPELIPPPFFFFFFSTSLPFWFMQHNYFAYPYDVVFAEDVPVIGFVFLYY
jgi:hypothetical protein